MSNKIIFMVLAVIFLPFAAKAAAEGEGGGMKITSPEFGNNEYIPIRFSGEGEDINPPLVVEGIPKEAKSLALIVDDPDAVRGTWVHWVVYNIPVTERIDENSVPGTQGTTDSGSQAYHGPCPPSGTHRYFFKIYALDNTLSLQAGARKPDLEKAMQGHILDKAELIGLYKRR